MNRFLSFITVITVMLLMTVNLYAQRGMSDIRKATAEVLGQGILQHNLENEFVILNDCFEEDSLKRGSANKYGWVITMSHVESTYVSVLDCLGGVWKIHPLATENLKFNMQWNAECFKLDSNKVVEYGVRVKIDSASALQSDFCAGLMTRNTAIDSMFDAGTSDGVYFYKKDGSANIWATTVKNTTTFDSVDTGVKFGTATAANPWTYLKIKWEGAGRLLMTVNDTVTVVLDSAAILPCDELLTPTISWTTGDAASRDFLFDYIYGKESALKRR